MRVCKVIFDPNPENITSLMCAQLLTCSTRRIFEKLAEIVPGRVTRSNGFSSFKISRVPHISWCASLIWPIFLETDKNEQVQTWMNKFRQEWGEKEKKKRINNLFRQNNYSTWFDARPMSSNLAKVVPCGETHSHWIHTVHENVINITRSTCLQKISKNY